MGEGVRACTLAGMEWGEELEDAVMGWNEAPRNETKRKNHSCPEHRDLTLFPFTSLYLSLSLSRVRALALSIFPSQRHNTARFGLLFAARPAGGRGGARGRTREQ